MKAFLEEIQTFFSDKENQKEFEEWEQEKARMPTIPHNPQWDVVIRKKAN